MVSSFRYKVGWNTHTSSCILRYVYFLTFIPLYWEKKQAASYFLRLWLIFFCYFEIGQHWSLADFAFLTKTQDMNMWDTDNGNARKTATTRGAAQSWFRKIYQNKNKLLLESFKYYIKGAYINYQIFNFLDQLNCSTVQNEGEREHPHCDVWQVYLLLSILRLSEIPKF